MSAAGISALNFLWMSVSGNRNKTFPVYILNITLLQFMVRLASIYIQYLHIWPAPSKHKRMAMAGVNLPAMIHALSLSLSLSIYIYMDIVIFINIYTSVFAYMFFYFMHSLAAFVNFLKSLVCWKLPAGHYSPLRVSGGWERGTPISFGQSVYASQPAHCAEECNNIEQQYEIHFKRSVYR